MINASMLAKSVSDDSGVAVQQREICFVTAANKEPVISSPSQSSSS